MMDLCADSFEAALHRISWLHSLPSVADMHASASCALFLGTLTPLPSTHKLCSRYSVQPLQYFESRWFHSNAACHDGI
jgi:hypothetical protein